MYDVQILGNRRIDLVTSCWRYIKIECNYNEQDEDVPAGSKNVLVAY